MAKKLTIEDFYLDDEKLSDGCKMPLDDANGRPTEHWIRVRYIHSDQVQAAIAAEYRAMFNAEDLDPEQIREKIKDRGSIERSIRHLLVADWSFETPCTPENVKELLRRNPEIASRIYARSENKRFFLPSADESSSNGQSENSRSSGSTRTPKAKAAAA